MPLSLSHRFALASAAVSAIFLSQTVQAQIVPDATLGTQVFGVCGGTGGACGIINGTTRGSNLFHSFQQFSLPNGDFAAFATNPAIRNVIVRVTGANISNINGTIATVDPTFTNLAPSNFFLLNPNGIVFGPGATLLNGGSFLATTAERMLFQDGTVFDTRDQTVAPLLTVSVPIGLQFGQTPGEIRSGLRIGAGINSLFTDFALVGGDVTLDDSIVVASGQRLELAAVGENGTVGLQQQGDLLSLSIPATTPLRDITLINNRSRVNTGSSKGGGEVVVTGRNIALNNGLIFAGILSGVDNAATNQAGTITINAIGRLELTQGSAIANLVGSNATGQGGDVHITAADIRVYDSSFIGTSTSGQGGAGNVRVTANTIALDGTTPNGLGSGGISSQVELTGNGRGGNVTVKTSSLMVANGAAVSASTFGRGDAGNVRVTANAIALNGSTLNGLTPGGIGSQVLSTGNGRGGDVTVEAGSLTVANGALVSASTFGQGNAGNVRVIAKTITVDGTTPNQQFVSGIGSQVAPTGIGRGGDITIQTDSLDVTNGAVISSSAFGNGSAGNLDITARTLRLEGSGITAVSVSGDGANITLNIGDLLLMRYGSSISTSAGLAGAGGNGGNITINAPKGFIVGVKGENSDISANAFTGSGGRVNITTQGIYGLQFRPQLTEFSDITASSTFGVSGVVAISTLGIDPSRGLQQLPGGLVDPSNRIDQKCAAGSGFRRSSFTVTGRGGLPENPLDPLQSGEGVASWVEVKADNPQPSSSTQNTSYGDATRTQFKTPHSIASSPLIEADSLMVDKDGSIQLVASRSIAAPSGSWHLPTCASVKERDR